MTAHKPKRHNDLCAHPVRKYADEIISSLADKEADVEDLLPPARATLGWSALMALLKGTEDCEAVGAGLISVGVGPEGYLSLAAHAHLLAVGSEICQPEESKAA